MVDFFFLVFLWYAGWSGKDWYTGSHHVTTKHICAHDHFALKKVVSHNSDYKPNDATHLEIQNVNIFAGLGWHDL